MRLRTLRNNVNLNGKRILLRIDANVPVKNGKTVDGKHGKIARASVGIQWLTQRGARVIVMSHMKRPGGKRVSAYSMKPVAKRLSSLLGMKVELSRDIVGSSVEKKVEKMKDGDVLMLENLRFDAREKKNSPAFARSLAKLGDMYINDAFAVSHRAHASVDAITSELPSYAGPLFAREVQVLGKILKSPRHPFIIAMGGLKLKTKLPTMKRLLPQVDRMLVGGALATAFLVAQGYNVGKSVYDEEGVPHAKSLLKTYRDRLMIPGDVMVASSLRANAKAKLVSLDEIGARDYIVDIGPNTMKAYQRLIKQAKTVVWNGPYGYCEVKSFCEGTSDLAKAIAARTGKATTVIGGGDTEPYVEQLGIYDKFSLVSTGGGAMLQFLSGEELPGVEALRV